MYCARGIWYGTQLGENIMQSSNVLRMCACVNSLRYLYGEYGWYEYTVRRDNQGKISCELKVTKEPHNAYIRK